MKERLAALEARVLELETRPRRAMKDTLRCPMCGGREILRTTAPVSDWVLMCLGTQGKLVKRAAVPCAAHACAACGFAEFHAKLDGLKLEHTDLEVLQGDGKGTSPYR